MKNYSNHLHLRIPLWNATPKLYAEAAIAWKTADDLVRSKASKPPPTLEDLQTSDMPPELLTWANDALQGRVYSLAEIPVAFTANMEAWVSGLSAELVSNDHPDPVAQPWCCSGPAGLALLLLGMRNWLDIIMSKPVHTRDRLMPMWEKAIKEATFIFQAVAKSPSL
jgi:hypothetical protein